MRIARLAPLLLAASLAVAPAARADDMPQLQEVLKPLPAPHPPTTVFDEADQKVGELLPAHDQRTVLLPGIPVLMRKALIDTEDPRFYQEGAFDIRGIGRAILADILAGRAKEGASTLTQQLARTLLNDRAKTLSRKVKEAWIAMQLEQRYSKDAILTLYFNDIYWGHGAYGIGAASDRYFDRSPSALDLGQMAVLAALVRGPGYYDPFNDHGVFRLAERQEYVLDRMVDAGDITRFEADAASHRNSVLRILQGVATHRFSRGFAAGRLRELLGIVRPDPSYRWFFNRVADEAALQLTRRDASGRIVQDGRQVLDGAGLSITVTMDPAMQQAAEEAAERGLARDGRRYGFSQVAIVAIDPSTGQVRALVGGLGATQYDRTVARLQTGSAFKPFVYLTAFEHGFAPDDIVDDEPARYPAGPGRWYVPHNDDYRFHGKVTLRTALIQSFNTVAVALEAKVGIDPIIRTARALGISSPLNRDLTLTLGSSGITPLEMCSAYAALANDGVWIQPSIFTRITGPGGQLLDAPVPQQRRAADVQPVRELVSVMQGVLGPGGTAGSDGIWRPAAGKTGTSNDFRDAWFVGFTPQLCAAVWVGNDDRHPMKDGAFGGTLAGRIWHDFMVAALKGKPVVPFAPPTTPTPAPLWPWLPAQNPASSPSAAPSPLAPPR